MSLEQVPNYQSKPTPDVFTERLAARRQEEQRVRKLYEAGFRKGEKILVADGDETMEWEIGGTFGDEQKEGALLYRFDPKTKTVTEKRIPFEELGNFKEKREAA